MKGKWNEDTKKTSSDVLPSNVPSLGVFDFGFKKKNDYGSVTLVLALYLILFFICWRFRHLIIVMSDVGDIFNDFPGDIVDTPKERSEQHKKQEELKG